MKPCVARLAGLYCLTSSLHLAQAHAAVSPEQTPFQCKPVTCSTLSPATVIDDTSTNDCAYRAGNLWWIDYVAGSLAWHDPRTTSPVVVAIFDDGAWTDHEDLRNQLWTNEAEAH